MFLFFPRIQHEVVAGGEPNINPAMVELICARIVIALFRPYFYLIRIHIHFIFSTKNRVSIVIFYF